jgi:hypothetical protein
MKLSAEKKRTLADADLAKLIRPDTVNGHDWVQNGQNGHTNNGNGHGQNGHVEYPLPTNPPPPREPTLYVPGTRLYQKENAPPTTPALITLNGVRILSAGNISTMMAPQSVGKSSIVEILAAAHLAKVAKNEKADTLGFSVNLLDNKKIWMIDTERSFEHFWYGIDKNAMRRGLGYEYADFTSEHLNKVARFEHVRGIKPANLAQLLTKGLQTKEYGLVLLDGVADLVNDPNSAEQASGVWQLLGELTQTYNVGIFTTLHPNPTKAGEEGKGRGHLGSEMIRRSESVFYIEMLKNTGIRRLHADNPYSKVRADDKSKLSAHFSWSEIANAFMSHECDFSADTTNNKVSESVNQLALLVDRCFGNAGGKLTAKDLAQKVCEFRGCESRTAYKRINDMVEHKLILKDKNRLYYRPDVDGFEMPF